MNSKAAVVAAGVLIAAAWVGHPSAQDAMRFADTAAQSLFLRSRAVVVSSGSVRQLRSVILRGHLTAVGDGEPVDGEIEIRCLLPDHFLRVETVGDTQRWSGYAGRSLLTSIRQGAKVERPPGNLTSTLLTVAHAHFTRLMLGALTYIPADQELTFRSGGATAAPVDPRVQASTRTSVSNELPERFVLDVMSDVFSARLEVDPISGVPVKLMYVGANRVPTTMRFADRRAVGGFLMPYRITTSAGDRVLETLTFDEILVNPEIAKADFKR